MKIVIIILSIILVAFIAFQIYSSMSQRSIEQYPYKVTKSYEGFEIRQYEASLFTSVKIGSQEYKKSFQ